jgi:hypothetical protein
MKYFTRINIFIALCIFAGNMLFITVQDVRAEAMDARKSAEVAKEEAASAKCKTGELEKEVKRLRDLTVALEKRLSELEKGDSHK